MEEDAGNDCILKGTVATGEPKQHSDRPTDQFRPSKCTRLDERCRAIHAGPLDLLVDRFRQLV